MGTVTEMHALNVAIGANIANLRITKEITQVDLAKKIEVSRASMVNIESGRQSVSTKRMMLLIIALNVTFDDIYPTKAWFLLNRNKKVRRTVIVEIIDD